MVDVPMKDPIIQLKRDEKIIFECTLRQLVFQYAFVNGRKLAAGDKEKLLLNFEEVEPPEDTEL